jgi:hypothetical protein
MGGEEWRQEAAGVYSGAGSVKGAEVEIVTGLGWIGKAEVMERIWEMLEQLVKDERVGPVHVCVFLALVRMKDCGERFRREEVMRLAKVKGKTTYFRVMKDLGKWGYIDYKPSFDWKRGSEVGV